MPFVGSIAFAGRRPAQVPVEAVGAHGRIVRALQVHIIASPDTLIRRTNFHQNSGRHSVFNEFEIPTRDERTEIISNRS